MKENVRLKEDILRNKMDRKGERRARNKIKKNKIKKVYLQRKINKEKDKLKDRNESKREYPISGSYLSQYNG